ncbi:acetyl-CoA carboxylase biotin carboxylase subunit [Bacteroidota bacterium]
MIKKILVANRGEIAIRIMRTCREMSISSVAVFSEADRTSEHVRYADEAYFIGPSPSAESYLNIDTIIKVAKESKADAIHPGYGFLSENANFSDRCKKEGIIFIGPSSEVISTMGDKITARKTMINSGVPVVPGTNKCPVNEEEIEELLKKIKLPIMIKASAGGGGKGMRLVRKKDDILEAINAAKSESLSAFGDDSVYIEKYIDSPHHIEFQILGDIFGNVIHLCERECSIQRRHQKVIEETPSPLMTDKLRDEMGKHAIAAAASVKYVGAGTIEFLVDDSGNYYFLEMNTRLQVEHPITERVTGIYLVKEQINIANGEKLRYEQKDIKQTGHAIECRIYAEDPDNNFMPSPGKIIHLYEPMGPGIRLDGYVYEGYNIPIYYDPMISKLIVWADTRKEAIQRMNRALSEYKITGIKTNIRFLEQIMKTKKFVDGKYNTHFIDNNLKKLIENNTQDTDNQDIAMVIAYLEYLKASDVNHTPSTNGTPVSNWREFGRSQALIRL